MFVFLQTSEADRFSNQTLTCGVRITNPLDFALLNQKASMNLTSFNLVNFI